ncbi:MAG: LysR family transcriptional regulator [Oscillospiraceae bacterium]
MNTKQLPYIVAIANKGSLSAAAAQLNISQPALSNYLADLHAQYGVEFFTRQNKQLYPTPAGQIYIAAACKILELQAQAAASIQMLQQGAYHQLRIGVTPHRGARLMASLYPQFNKMFPQTELIIKEGYADQLMSYVLSGETDYSLSTFLENEKTSDDLEFLPICEEDVLLSVPTFIPAPHSGKSIDGKAPLVDLADFQSMPFVMMGKNTTLGQLSLKCCKEAGFSPTIVYCSSNVMFVDAMIRSGAGVGLIPGQYAVPADEVSYYRLQTPSPFCTCFITRRGHTYIPQMRYLVYLFMKSCIENSCYHFCFGPDLNAIVDEFENVPLLPTGKEGVHYGY